MAGTTQVTKMLEYLELKPLTVPRKADTLTLLYKALPTISVLLKRITLFFTF